MSKVSKIDKAIATIEFILKDRKRIVERTSKRLDLDQNQKIYIGKETELIQNVEYLISETKNKYNETLGRIPPQDLAIEEGVLGALILENKGHHVMDFLRPDHFYKGAHQEIYRALVGMRLVGTPIDMRSVVVQLRALGKIEQVGGAYYIADITSRVASAANIEFHARIMVEMAIQRKIILECGILVQDAYDDGKDCFELLEELEKVVTETKAWVK